MSDETLEKKDKFKILVSKIKENSRKIILGFLIILVIFFSLAILENKKKKKDVLISEEFNSAKILIKNEKRQEGLIILERIVDKKNKVYSPLSLYLIIDFQLEKDKEKIIKMFDKIISIKKIDEENIKLIKIKKALFLSENYSEQEMLDILNPIINSDSVWRSYAINLLIDYFTNKGSFTKAEQYKNLINKKDNK